MVLVIVPGLILRRRWQNRADDLLSQGLPKETVVDIISADYDVAKDEVREYIRSNS